ncbi:hypothetical protein ACFV0T_37555, partial [Streptomyces sp. NPDC059582]|uniref:hypothetical protein n=1 Tax=Streptomyces sp. NPDC059582 TaxID=3346875 RepID=UPI00368A3C8F
SAAQRRTIVVRRRRGRRAEAPWETVRASRVAAGRPERTGGAADPAGRRAGDREDVAPVVQDDRPTNI